MKSSRNISSPFILNNINNKKVNLDELPSLDDINKIDKDLKEILKIIDSSLNEYSEEA